MTLEVGFPPAAISFANIFSTGASGGILYERVHGPFIFPGGAKAEASIDTISAEQSICKQVKNVLYELCKKTH